MNKNSRGFTLIELLVVISIIALLSSIVLSSLSVARERGEQSRVVSERRAIQTALAVFNIEKGAYPDPGNQNQRNCIARSSCVNGSEILAPLSAGDFSSNLAGFISSYPSNTPLITIAGQQYSGPFYTCTSRVGTACEAAQIIWTTRESTCDIGSVILSSSKGSLCRSDAGSTEDTAGSY